MSQNVTIDDLIQDHTTLANHVAAAVGHHVTGNIVGTSDTQVLTNKTISATNNTLSGIDHTSLSNIGTNTHAQIDTHIAASTNPHGSTLTQTTLNVTNLNVSGGFSPSSLTAGILKVTPRLISGSTATGTLGEICFGTDGLGVTYLYVCKATNSWVRISLSNLLWP